MAVTSTPLAGTPLLRRPSRFGGGLYATFAPGALSDDLQPALAAGCATAHHAIEARGNALGTVVQGWQEIPPMGTYGDDYLFRSAVAWKFIYTNSPAEALCPIAETDDTGVPRTG